LLNLSGHLSDSLTLAEIMFQSSIALSLTLPEI